MVAHSATNGVGRRGIRYHDIDPFVGTNGVDGILVGLQDLTLDLGLPGQHRSDEVGEIVEKCLEVCRRHSKFAGLGGTEDTDLMRKHIGMGFRFALIGSDRNFLMQMVSSRVSDLRGKSD